MNVDLDILARRTCGSVTSEGGYVFSHEELKRFAQAYLAQYIGKLPYCPECGQRNHTSECWIGKALKVGV